MFQITYHFGVSRCGCVGLHLHDAAGEGAAGGVAAAALAVPPPNMAEQWPRIVALESQSE